MKKNAKAAKVSYCPDCGGRKDNPLTSGMYVCENQFHVSVHFDRG